MQMGGLVHEAYTKCILLCKWGALPIVCRTQDPYFRFHHRKVNAISFIQSGISCSDVGLKFSTTRQDVPDQGFVQGVALKTFFTTYTEQCHKLSETGHCVRSLPTRNERGGSIQCGQFRRPRIQLSQVRPVQTSTDSVNTVCVVSSCTFTA